MSKYKFETLQVHVGQETPDSATDSRAVPIYATTSYVFKDSAQAAGRFALTEGGNIYTRLMNPTSDIFEQRIAALEGGAAALSTASGSSAITYAVQNIATAGDHIVSSTNLYGGTYNLFDVTLRKLGIECIFVDQDANEEEIDKAFKENTKLIFGETIANPIVSVFDIEKFANIAHKHGVPLIMDNTFATPINCRPFEFGCDIVTHSTTKYMDGHALTVGGCIVDSGNFDWMKYGKKFHGLTEPDESYHGITYCERFGKFAYITKATAQLMRDFGSIQSPQNAFLLNIGLETLHLRMARHCENAKKVAEFLSKNPKVAWINYSDLEGDKYHALQQKYLPNGSCGVMAFGIKGGRSASIKFMDSLKFISIVTHVADSKTCLLHPASHTHRQMSDEQLLAAGIKPDLIRLSVGIENVDDILDDLKQALDKVEL